MKKPVENETEKFTKASANDYLASSKKVTESIQAAIGIIAEKNRKTWGDAVADGLHLWKEKTRYENVLAWVTGHYADFEKQETAGDPAPRAFVDLWDDWEKTWPPEWAEACNEYAKSLYDPDTSDDPDDPDPSRAPTEEELRFNLIYIFTMRVGVVFLGGSLAWGERDLLANDPAPRWLRLLLAPLVAEEAERLAEEAERRKQKARAVPLAIQPRNMVNTKTGNAFLRFPTALTDAGAWGREMVEVDGAAFADEPKLEGVRIYQPRAWTVAPGNMLAPPTGQLFFPGFNLDPETNPDLACFLSVAAGDAVATMKDAGKVCAKLLPLLFAMCPLDGTPIQGTYDDLRKLVYPDYKDRRAAEADRVRVGAATAALHSLRLVARMGNNRTRVLPLLGGGHYDTYTGNNLEAGAIFRLNPDLLDMVTPEPGKGNFFLVNLSNLLTLDAKDPVSIAVALRIYAYWHTCKQRGHWMPDRLRPLDVDALLVTANAVNQRTAETISGQRGETQDLKKLSKARAALVDKTLPKLAEAGILDPKTLEAVRRPAKGSRGTGWAVTPQPPPDYLEASKKAARLTRRKVKG